MIDIRPLKQKTLRSEDSTVKTLILSLPDEISKEDLVSKMDLVLALMNKEDKIK